MMRQPFRFLFLILTVALLATVASAADTKVE